MSHKLFISGMHLLLVIAVINVYHVSGRHVVYLRGNPTVDENQDITYACSAGCSGSCIYYWSVTGIYHIDRGVGNLTLRNVQRRAGGGTYNVTCLVRDDDPYFKFRTKSLDVYYGPDSVTITPGATLTIQEGTAYTAVECVAVSCYPTCSLKWKKGRTTVVENGKLFKSPDVATKDQAGSYECIATNTGKATPTSMSGTISLTITYPPNVTASWSGSTSTLTCRAEGVPAKYKFGKWDHAFNGVNIRELIGGKSGSTLTYEFSTTSYQDRGVYTCIVNNGIVPIGSSDPWIRRTVYVNPNDKPRLNSYRESYNVSKGDSLPIELDIYAYPAISRSDVTIMDSSSERLTGGNVRIDITPTTVFVEFYSKTIPVTGQKVTATIQSALEQYFGNVHINIRNGFGDASCNITLYPEGPPEPPLNLHVSSTAHDTVTLTFRSGFFNGGSQTFVVEYNTGIQGAQWMNGSSVFAGDEKNLSLSANINGLTPETFYMFRAYGYNIYDRSEYADILVNATTQEAPLAPGAIIGGTIGGVLGGVVVIAVIIVVCRWRMKSNSDSAARYRERKHNDKELVTIQNCVTADKGKTTNDSGPVSAKDNPVYMMDEPDYENTTLKNFVTSNKGERTEDLVPASSKDDVVYVMDELDYENTTLRNFVSLDQDPSISMSAKKYSRVSIPLHIAYPPPVPVPNEGDYVNIKLG